MANVMSLSAERLATEVSEKAKRRKFTAEYKARIVREAEGCTQSGEIGALLRREGLYSSHLLSWRAHAKRGELAGLTPQRRGPKPKPNDPRDREIAVLRRDIARLTHRAERAEAIIEVQKKLSKLLGIVLPEPPPEEN
jgi:transposase